MLKFIKETIIYLIQASIIVAATVALGAEAYLYYKDVIEEKPFHNYQCDCRCDQAPAAIDDSKVTYDNALEYACIKGILFVRSDGGLSVIPNPDGSMIKCDYKESNVKVIEPMENYE